MDKLTSGYKLITGVNDTGTGYMGRRLAERAGLNKYTVHRLLPNWGLRRNHIKSKPILSELKRKIRSQKYLLGY
jgi:hypothetical protein